MNGVIKNQYGVLKGKIRSEISISATVRYPIDVCIPTYDGNYQVVPKSTEQLLSTKDKQMTDDVTIKAIPYFETSNEDGITIFIGSEVE